MYKTLIIEKIKLPSVVNEWQGDTDVGFVCLSHVVFHCHHVSFHFSLNIGAFSNYWVCSVKIVYSYCSEQLFQFSLWQTVIVLCSWCLCTSEEVHKQCSLMHHFPHLLYNYIWTKILGIIPTFLQSQLDTSRSVIFFRDKYTLPISIIKVMYIYLY